MVTTPYVMGAAWRRVACKAHGVGGSLRRQRLLIDRQIVENRPGSRGYQAQPPAAGIKRKLRVTTTASVGETIISAADLA